MTSDLPEDGELRIGSISLSSCDECSLGDEVGLNEVGTISGGLVNAPMWGFWWD